MKESLNIGAQSRVDYRTALTELDASEEQAFLVAAHACAWRIAVVLLPVSFVASLVMFAIGTRPALPVVVLPVIALVGPLAVTMIVSFPVLFVAGAQTFYRGSRDAQVRFGAGGWLAYVSYGWRYAFRGRQRPWGAMTLAEKRVSNPRRAAAYWPESTDK